MTKPVAKSLHTVTVIVQLAKFCRGVTVFGDDLNARAVDYAMDMLGLSGRLRTAREGIGATLIRPEGPGHPLDPSSRISAENDDNERNDE